MSRGWVTRGWVTRLVGAAVLAVAGYGVLVLMDFGPRPFGWGLLTVVGCAVAWLVLDTLDAERPQWLPTLPPQGDRVEETTADDRLVDDHVSASAPGPALRDRLVALAFARDPDLADAELAALASEVPRRLSPADIDRYLTRIEELRDRD